MAGSLEGLEVTITFEVTGFFEDETKVLPVSVPVTIGEGEELVTQIEARILSDTDGDGDMEPVAGPNGLLTGTVRLDISGNEIFASYSGQAQPAGFQIIIDGLTPEGVAPGTIEDQGGMSGVNSLNTPSYDAGTGTLTLDWTFLGFQPGTTVNQTVFYDNLLEDAPVAEDDSFDTDAVKEANGNVLDNDTDLDNAGSIGIVDPTVVSEINGQAADLGSYVGLAAGGRVLLKADGSFTFDPNGDFFDLAEGETRDVTFEYTAADTADLTDTGMVTISVTGVATDPVVTTSGGTADFVENTAIAVDTLLTLSDPDSTTLASGTVSITTNHTAAEDRLTFESGVYGDISGTFDVDTGVLNLVSDDSTATLAQWQAALRSVQYENLSEAPDTADRTITFEVNDGQTSAVATKALTVEAVNDAPTLGGVPSALPIEFGDETVTLNFSDVTLLDPDIGDGDLQITVTADDGLLSGLGQSDVSSITLTDDLASVLTQITVPGAISYAPKDGAIGPNVDTITITVDDLGSSGTGGSLTASETIAVAITDSVAPEITSVSVPAAETYTAGQTLSFTVDFSETVTVNTTGGTPSLAVMLGGGVTLDAAFASGSGTNTLTFEATVQDGQFDPDGIELGSAIALNGATIRDDSGNDSDLQLASIGDLGDVLVDAVAPSVTSFTLPAAGNYRTGEALTFRVQLSEDVTVDATTAPFITLELDGGATVSAEYGGLEGTDTLVFEYQVAAKHRDLDGITLKDFDINGAVIEDLAGNAFAWSGITLPDASGIRINVPTPPSPDPEPEPPTETDPVTPGGSVVIEAQPSADGTPTPVEGTPDVVDEVRISGSVALGTDLDNAYLTGDGDNTVIGNDLDNVIYGNLGNTTIVASGGNDTIDGGWGDNTVQFSGNAADYSVEIVDGFAVVTNTITGDVTRLSNIQQLEFADGTQPLFATSQVVLAGLYETVLGRAPDPEGFAYWMSQSAVGETVGEMAAAFLASQEFDERDYEPDPASFINDLYEQFLDRPADTAGLAYWVERVESGAGYAEVAVNFVLSDEVGERLDALFSRADWIDAA